MIVIVQSSTSLVTTLHPCSIQLDAYLSGAIYIHTTPCYEGLPQDCLTQPHSFIICPF